MSKPAIQNKLIVTLLASAAMALPGAAHAQQLSSEWAPFDDAPPAEAGQGDTASESRSDRRRGSNKPRAEFTPYIEAQQVLVADLKDGGDVLTYTTVAAGVDASISTRRAEAQVNVRYERVIGYDSNVDDQDNVTGLARGSVALVPGLRLEAGALAARTKVDGRGPSPTNQVGNPDNVTQVYSVYAGPSLSTKAGPLDVNASYQAGYTKVESRDVDLPTGQEPFATFDDSVSHSAYASVGIQPGGDLPIGVTVSGAWEREDASVLDNRYEGKYARADVTVPIGSSFAVTGGVGYEDIEISERDALRDGAGDPVIDGNGRFVTDPNSPRLVAYQEDGLIWDAGVMWRPSRRTSLSAYYGQRYGSDTYGGSFTYQPGNDFAVNVSAYDTVTGFGGQLTDSLASLPSSFRVNRNPLTGDVGSCAFSGSGGSCFNDSLQSVNNAAFRSRGVTGSVVGRVGGWDAGFAAGYNRRKFLTSFAGAQPELADVVDQNYFALASLGTKIDNQSRFDTNVYLTYFDPGFTGAPDVLSTGINAAYYRQIFKGLSATAAVGLDSFRQEDFDTALTGSALVGLRYSF